MEFLKIYLKFLGRIFVILGCLVLFLGLMAYNPYILILVISILGILGLAGVAAYSEYKHRGKQ